MTFSTKLAVLVFIVAASQPLTAQSFYVSRIWMRVYGQFGAYEAMTFGNTGINTFGVDSTAPDGFKEMEPPPMSAIDASSQAAAPSFESIWVLPPGHAGAWGSYRGLLRYDWRDLVGPSEARRDTWAVKFAQNDNLSATICFKWPDPTYLAAECDSLTMYDVSGKMGWPNNRLNMFTTDTLTIPAAGDSLISVFRIFKVGAKGTLDLKETSSLPATMEFLQNYPNPFNPSTKLVVATPGREFITLKIYDILGREVETIFAGIVEPGRQEFVWEPTGLPSGIYFAALSTGHRRMTQRLLLAK